jgi:hypothetical protein
MTVLDPGGAVLAAPQLVSHHTHARLAFWADLNGDGREDFVALVWSGGCGLGGYRCDVAFALSSEEGYRITPLGPTMGPGANDFVDLGDGRCRFVHTSFVYGRGEPGTDGKPHNYWVYNLLEFEGDRVVVSRADPRFPRWVWYTHAPNHEETSIITAEQKERLWEAQADGIFRVRRREAGATVAQGDG